jgi:hypothetical protein
MKEIMPALNALQIACMDRNASLTDMANARKALFAAIRKSLVDMRVAPSEAKFLADFDKLNA